MGLKDCLVKCIVRKGWQPAPQVPPHFFMVRARTRDHQHGPLGPNCPTLTGTPPVGSLSGREDAQRGPAPACRPIASGRGTRHVSVMRADERQLILQDAESLEFLGLEDWVRERSAAAPWATIEDAIARALEFHDRRSVQLVVQLGDGPRIIFPIGTKEPAASRDHLLLSTVR